MCPDVVVVSNRRQMFIFSGEEIKVRWSEKNPP